MEPERRNSGYLAVLLTIAFSFPAFFLVMSTGEIVDGIYFEDIPVHRLEMPYFPCVFSFAVSFGLFGGAAMRCLNKDYGKITPRKILIVFLVFLLSLGILFTGTQFAINSSECYTEDGIMAVNRDAILVYTWDDVETCCFESDDEEKMFIHKLIQKAERE